MTIPEPPPTPKPLTWKEKLKLLFEGLKKLPYKWYWIALMICSSVLFSWWDEIIIWTIGVAWNWRIVPVYYFAEYCVMLPLTLFLTKKTYEKLNLKIQLRQVLIQSLKNSLPVLIYRKLKGMRHAKRAPINKQEKRGT